VRLRTPLVLIFFPAACLFSQENPDSLYRNILFKRDRSDLSVIQVDKAIALENQRIPLNSNRIAELYFYRGGLLQFEKRLEEAIEAYTRSLNLPGEKWTADSARFNRGLVYDALGSSKAGSRGQERLAASQLYWFGANDGLESHPAEFDAAEQDYSAVNSLAAREKLLRLHLIMGKISEAAAGFRGLQEDGNGSLQTRLKAYEILLCEANEDFQSADRFDAELSAEERKQLAPLLDDVRSNRLQRTIRFDWIDRTAHETDVSLSSTNSTVESGPYSVMDLRFVTKRLMFEGADGGFLVSSDAGAFGLVNGGRGGYGMDLDILGTFLNGTQSLPGGGFLLGFESFGGPGKRILKTGGETVSEKSGSRFGFSVNGGIRQKLFAFAGFTQRSAWLKGLSDGLSAADAMLDSLGIRTAVVRRTRGVYGMGSAGTGWWPGKTHSVTSDLTAGFKTHLSRNLTFGAAYSRLTSDVTDHFELTVDDMSATYAHRIFVSERIHLIRLDSEIRFAAGGFRFTAGGGHAFECSSGIRFNSRSAQVVQSVPGADGIHPVLLGNHGQRLAGAGLSAVKDATGYLPSVSTAYFRTSYSNLTFSAESAVNGLRARNREIRFRLEFQPGRRTLTQCLHDLAPWR